MPGTNSLDRVSAKVMHVLRPKEDSQPTCLYLWVIVGILRTIDGASERQCELMTDRFLQTARAVSQKIVRNAFRQSIHCSFCSSLQ